MQSECQLKFVGRAAEVCWGAQRAGAAATANERKVVHWCLMAEAVQKISLLLFCFWLAKSYRYWRWSLHKLLLLLIIPHSPC